MTRLTKIYQIKNDHAFCNMVPTDPNFDTAQLLRFRADPSEPFPLLSMKPIPSEEENEEYRGRCMAECFLLYGLSFLMLSARAATALRDVLEAYGQLCVVETPLGDYFACGRSKVINCLDYINSEIEYQYSMTKRTKLPRDIKRYGFDVQAIGDTAVFEIPEFPVTKLFCSDAFVTTYTGNKLTGLTFEMVFPAVDERHAIQQKYLRKRRRGKLQ